MRDSIRVARPALTATGLLILGNAAAATVLTNMHAGIYFTYALGAILVLWGLLGQLLPRFVRIVLISGVAAATVWVGSTYIAGAFDTVDYREDAVVVLGTGIRGTALSDSLRLRLDAALDYHAHNPRAVIVVSGGQGPQEDIPEADAMAAYLIAHGVDEKLILREAASTNTRENFALSRPLLDARLGDRYRIAYITNDFHIARAGWIAEAAGFTQPTHARALTPLYMIIPNGLRECAAQVKYWLGIT